MSARPLPTQIGDVWEHGRTGRRVRVTSINGLFVKLRPVTGGASWYLYVNKLLQSYRPVRKESA